jgi:hypothetical protein
LRGLQGSFSASIQKVEEKLQAILQTEIPITDEILAEAVEEVTRQRDLERVSLAHFIHEMRLKETQQEILTLLLEEANRFAPRVALFVMREDRITGWSSRGYSKEVAEKIAGVSIVQSESRFLQRALLSEGLTSCADLAGEPGAADLMQQEASGPWHAFSMRAFQRPVAVLLAAAADNCRCDLESLCLIMDVTGLYIENLALKILHDLHIPAPPKTDQPSGTVELPQETVAAPEAEPALPFDEAEPEISAQPPAFSQEAEPAITADLQPETAPEPIIAPAAPAEVEHVLEAVPESLVSGAEPTADDAAPSVPIISLPELMSEAAGPTADAAAASVPIISLPESMSEAAGPAVADPASAPEAAALRVVDSWMADLQTPEPPATTVPATEFIRPIGFPSTDDQSAPEEERLHVDAKRFARLLVSEVKLYNEERLQEGRENRDIYVRLKKDIDRSREAYRKRVSPIVTRKIDYFHDELVRILGDNDPSSLGSDYPGPLVES